MPVGCEGSATGTVCHRKAQCDGGGGDAAQDGVHGWHVAALQQECAKHHDQKCGDRNQAD